MELPGIGRGIGAAIVEIVNTGSWSQLDRLLGTLEPDKLFQTVPGIGARLAARIHDVLHADTLEQLEQAAHDGRLENMSGYRHAARKGDQGRANRAARASPLQEVGL